MNKNYILFYIIILFFSNINYSQTVLGKVQDNTNLALPSSYKFKEYVFAEPNDQGDCNGSTNSTASIDKIFFAQTHRRNLDHPFHFLIGHRPSLFQLSVLGSGNSPDIKVEGFMNGTSLGEKCLKGPSTLSETIDTTIPDFEKYFSVTLPKSWVKIGLTLKISIGSITRNISAEELKIGPYTEMNLVQYDMDVLDYNSQKSISQNPLKTKPDNFLQEIASAIPASVIRYGIFPEKLVFPEIIANNGTEQLVRLQTKNDKKTNGINSDGSINSITSLFLSNLHASSSDYLSTIYFGNTMNLRPGGWGGGRSFVSFDFDDVFIHELGHALSLPHWGGNYKKENPGDAYVYPYGGDPSNYNGTNGNGGGRGESWNFTQYSYEFVSPTCGYDGRGVAGTETSDAMQRNNFCLEKRTNGAGPWDGFGDFSALAMHRFLVGASQKNQGKINYRSNDESFQFSRQDGFPVVSLENNKRVYKRHSSQPTESYRDRMNKVLLEDEKIEQDIYLIYGTTHPNQSQANIIYKPIKTKGTLPKIIDPTNQSILDELKSDRIYMDFLGSPHDITYKITYKDGEILHLINPTNNYTRTEDYSWGYHIWRNDLSNFSIRVPGDKEVVKVELYKRPFLVSTNDNSKKGNINYYNDITADNFMDDAIFLTDWVLGRKVDPKTVNIGGTVWYDFNKNSLMDQDEKGIENVSVYLWGDSNNDGVPDGKGNGTNGNTKTNSNGEYFFSGLPEGNYQPFVWSVNNWEEGQPLHNYLLSPKYTDANNDIDNDSNGRGFPGRDLKSGIVELSLGNEPLNDGDKEDDWWNIDASSNRTVDFGFYYFLEENNNQVSATNTTCIGKNDGSLELSIKDNYYDYNITVTGKDVVNITGDSKTAYLTGLTKGLYNVCFKIIDGSKYSNTIRDYEQCFEVAIGEPKALSAFVDVDNDKRTTNIQLGGSNSYNIEVNGERFDVKGDRFNTTLPTGLSIIKISTDLDCQGVIEREIFISEDIFYYPNPTRGEVDVFVNGEDKGVKMSVFTTKGDLVFTRDQEILDSRKTELDLTGVPSGTYLVTLEGTTVRKTFKIVKK